MIVLIDGNGIVLDPHIDWTLETVAAMAKISDVCLYSHGWSANGEQAMTDDSCFTAGFGKNFVEVAERPSEGLALPGASSASHVVPIPAGWLATAWRQGRVAQLERSSPPPM